MTLSIVLHLSQQLTGMIGVYSYLKILTNYFHHFLLTSTILLLILQVLFYSTDIFAAAGVQYSEVATVVVGITLLGFTIVTVSDASD